MASTIKLKNGSGAPLAGDLVQGEPALDLTNKRLYTENASGTVIEVGTNPTSITTGTITASGEITANGGIALGDNDKATFGASDDLQIYHDGSNSYVVDEGTGYLVISTAGPAIRLNSNTAEVMLETVPNGAVTAYYDNAPKLATTSTGVDVTGTVTADSSQIVSSGTPTVDATVTGLQISRASYPQLVLDGQNEASGQKLLGIANDEAGMLFRKFDDTFTTSTYLAKIHSNNDISFYEDTGTTAKFFWDASAESLGIGTTSPSYALDVVGDGRFTRSGTTSGNIYLGGSSNYVYADAVMAFGVGGTERMRIDSSGNVGIGTTTPSEKLVIFGNALLTTGYKIYGNANAGLTSSYLSLYNAVDGGIDLMANYTTSKITFGTAGSERMRIDSSGNLLVGTTDGTPYASNVKGAAFYNSGAISGSVDGLPAMYLNRKTSDGTIADFRKDGTTVGSISVTSSTTTYNITSDQRLKENITDAPAGNVDDIKVRSFDWKADGSHQEYGMVAQELEAVAPYAVTKGETEDDMWSVDYSKLVPMLIKEIQSLRARVAQLETN